MMCICIYYLIIIFYRGKDNIRNANNGIHIALPQDIFKLHIFSDFNAFLGIFLVLFSK